MPRLGWYLADVSTGKLSIGFLPKEKDIFK
jgi:hypothetical protein